VGDIFITVFDVTSTLLQRKEVGDIFITVFDVISALL